MPSTASHDAILKVRACRPVGPKARGGSSVFTRILCGLGLIGFVILLVTNPRLAMWLLWSIAAGGREHKVVVIPSGVDPAPFRRADGEGTADVRRTLGLSDSIRLLVGLFGRVAPWKGQHLAIEAAARLDTTALVIVGAPLFGEVAYEAELARLVERLGLAGRVKLLGFREDIPRLMRAVDVVVHTSTAPEPFGRVLVEAMLVERPVIASDAGGAREIVEDGVTGLLVPPGQPDALAEALRRLLDDPALRLAMGRRGRERAERQFTLVPTLEALDRLVASVASER